MSKSDLKVMLIIDTYIFIMHFVATIYKLMMTYNGPVE